MNNQLIIEAKSLCERLQGNNYEVLILGAHKLEASKSFLEGTPLGRQFVESSVSLLNKFTSFCYEGTSTATEKPRPESQASKGNIVYGNICIKQEVEDDFEPPSEVPEPPAVFGRHGRKIKAPKWKEDYFSPKATKRAQKTEEEGASPKKRMKANNSDPKMQSQTKESSKIDGKLSSQRKNQTEKAKSPIAKPLERKQKEIHKVTEKVLENTKQTSEISKLYMAYSCSVCNKIFSSQDDVDKHEKTHEVKNSCQLCSEVLQSVEDLFFHLHKQHSDNFCFWCNIFKDNTTEMEMHKANCTTEGDFKRKCHFCVKEWHSRNEFEDHVINWHGPKDQKCSQCEISFSSPLALSDHEREHKLTKENYCVECKRDFSSSQDFLDHVLKNHISVSSDTANDSKPEADEGSTVDKNIAEIKGSSVRSAENVEVNTSDLSEEKENDFMSDENFGGDDDDDDDYVVDDGDDEDDEQDMQSTPSGNQLKVTIKKKKKEGSKLTPKSRKKSFPCTICKKTFSRLYLMQKHVKTHEKVYLYVECRLCKETFSNKYLELKHLLANHKEIFCLWCDATFKDEAEKKAHDNACPSPDENSRKKCHVCSKHLASKLNFENHFFTIHCGDFKCQICGHIAVSKYMFDRHMCSHGEGEKMECPECSKMFTRKEHLDKHLRQVHKVTKPKVVKEIFPCECQVCQAGFHSRTELADHIKVSHMAEIDEKIIDNPKFTINFHEDHFICKKCGKSSTNEDELAIHMASHLGIMNKNDTFICDICGETFHKKNLFTAHRARHTNIKAFPCTKCNKKFHVRSSLESHLQTHRTYRDFVCHICGNAFKSRPSLRMHAKRHDMDRCHVCKYCNRTFRCYDGLKYHWVVYHPEEVKKRKLTVFPCSYCDKVLATKTQHARHMAKHGVEKNHRCEFCNNMYCTVAQLNAHIKNTHEQNRNIYCSACDLYFLIPSKMLRHMKSHKHNENCAKKGIHPSAFYELLANMEKDMVESVDLQQYRAAKSSTKYRKLYKSMGGLRKDLEVENNTDLMGMLQNEETVTIDLSNVQYIDNLPKEVLEEVEISDQNLKPNTEVFVVYDQGPESSGQNPRNMSLDAQAVETLQSILNLSNQH
ncbi:zinc finger protein 836-like [Saccostrea echinata]|uniref:zinc finger protein 836-like n=1 Tax=Saccostrea echinata TaxID=191078 RepID=UPI002A841245|nr:zinc finger protein 836-like [Saccostrea echinata]